MIVIGSCNGKWLCPQSDPILLPDMEWGARGQLSDIILNRGCHQWTVT